MVTSNGKGRCRGTLYHRTTSLCRKQTQIASQQPEDQHPISRHIANHLCATVAMAALRRKNAHKHTLEQTSAQMLTIEREISSIETANINKETLSAMTNATKAMKTIHGGLTVDKVDQTMYVAGLTIQFLSLAIQALTMLPHTGKISENNMQSARKSPRPSRKAQSVQVPWTRTS
jgi:hypothetical protein